MDVLALWQRSDVSSIPCRRKVQALEKEKKMAAFGAKGAGAATERLQKELDKLK